MSDENLDIASVYGTNRVQNGVTIYCVQDTTFTDIRMRKLADIVIDLTEWYQSGRFRIAKLRKIRMDKNSKPGIKEVRFMTYEHGEWVTQENIACELPDPDTKKLYDEMRERKEAENSKAINRKYNKMLENEEIEDNRPRCPHCNSTRLYHSKKGVRCNGCGRYI
jgi:DNA-directed RNA polymerase subunit RPC12/RpoP